MARAKTPESLKYPVIVRELDEQDGGGFLAEVPDLPGCQSDGDTPEAALESVKDAIAAWIATAKELRRPIPQPDLHRYSGKWVQRVPRSLHRKLAQRARSEGVSLNALAATLLAEGLGVQRKPRRAA